MAKIISTVKNTATSSWKGGMASGGIAGLCQGIPAAIGLHPFFARIGGGILAATIIKNPVDKRVVLNESVKEGIYQLLAGE